MSKTLKAECDGSEKVFYGDTEVISCEILSEGKQKSDGILVIDKGKTYYLTSSATDIKTTLEKISSALTEIATALTTIDAKPVGGTGSAPAPAVGGNVATLNTLKSEIDQLKGALK